MGLTHLTGSVFELQLVHRGIPPKALKRRIIMRNLATTVCLILAVFLVAPSTTANAFPLGRALQTILESSSWATKKRTEDALKNAPSKKEDNVFIIRNRNNSKECYTLDKHTLVFPTIPRKDVAVDWTHNFVDVLFEGTRVCIREKTESWVRISNVRLDEPGWIAREPYMKKTKPPQTD
jgi:hypothetical protein